MVTAWRPGAAGRSRELAADAAWLEAGSRLAVERARRACQEAAREQQRHAALRETIAQDVEGLPPELELRCPEPWGLCQAGKLLAKLRLSGERPSFVHPDNLIEMSCPDCVKRLRKAGRRVSRVLHRFDFAGQLVETLVVEDPVGN
jgi:hypothetical protein